MAAVIDIQNILSTPEHRLSPVPGDRYIDALKNEYDEKVVFSTIQWVFAQSDNSFSGMKAFKERILDSFSGMISVQDQKYLADIAHRKAINIL